MLNFIKRLLVDTRGTTLAITYTFSANTLAQSSQVNQNFSDVVAVVNALTADNLADDAVTAAKLNSNVVRSGYGLIQHTDGSLYVDVSDTNPCLEITDGGLRLKVDGVTLERASGGVQCVATKIAFLDTAQTFSGDKTFSGFIDLFGLLKLNGSAGNAGQCLLSQGSGSDPIWSDVVVSYNTSESSLLSATATNSYVDSGLTSITFTPSNANNIILISWGFSGYNTTNNGGHKSCLNIDGSNLTANEVLCCTVGNDNTSLYTATGSIITKLSAASHEIKIYFRDGGISGATPSTVTAKRAWLHIMEVYNG